MSEPSKPLSPSASSPRRRRHMTRCVAVAAAASLGAVVMALSVSLASPARADTVTKVACNNNLPWAQVYGVYGEAVWQATSGGVLYTDYIPGNFRPGGEVPATAGTCYTGIPPYTT